MHKRTGKLAKLLKGTWFGDIIIYDDWPVEKPITGKAPFIFDDDKRFDLTKYEILGEL